MLRALALEGARLIKEHLLEAGYRGLAESYGDEDRARVAASHETAAETWRG